MIEVLGKADKYFTLWYKGLVDGKECYMYVKNVSTDKTRAFELYPNAEYCEWLRGKGVYVTCDKPEPVHYDENVMPVGKYKGSRFYNIPVDYLVWFVNSFDGTGKDMEAWYNNAVFNIFENVLLNAGYERFRCNSRIFALKKDDIRLFDEDLDDRLVAGLPFTVVCDANPSEDGLACFENITIKFPEVRENYYNGYTYYLPVLNGKAKRIKGKPVEITEYVAEAGNSVIRKGIGYAVSYNINIISWRILK